MTISDSRDRRQRPPERRNNSTFDWLAAFLVQSVTCETISELGKIAVHWLLETLPLSYVAVFLHEHSSKVSLKAESEMLLEKAGITEIGYDELAAVRNWPCPLSELLTVSPDGKEKLNKNSVGRLLCITKRVEDKISTLLCYRLKDEALMQEKRDFLDLTALQIALSLERIKKEQQIRGELFAQIDEMVDIERIILRSERQSCMAEMALGVADGIRNPLSVIGGMLRRISKRMDVKSPFQKDCAILLQEVERLDQLVRDFEKFARKRDFVFKGQDINWIIRQTVEIIKHDFLREKDVNFRLDLDNRPCHIKVDKNLMGAALTHLVLNALEATKEGGEIAIITRQSQDQVIIEIKDNGSGIAPKHMDRIFDPFFTTKPGGTGLGLTYVQQIVSEHQGEMSVNSKLGEGTNFIITLPRE